MIKVGDKYLRNLEEQVQYLTDYHAVNQGLVQWGIRVVGQVETAEELPLPYDGEYGDAIAVGTEAPFFFYIWTRASIEGGEAYWFPFGEISTIGPQGPKGDKGDKGDTGLASRWYYGTYIPDESSPSMYIEGDMYLQSDGRVYRYQNDAWQSVTNIRGPQGIQGIQGEKGNQGSIGPEGPQGPKGDVGGLVNIKGILANIDQLPLPSSLQNLTVAYLVGTQQPYDLYIQIGDTSEDAVWTNTGPFNAATLVTVNGIGQNVFNADSKLNAPSTINTYSVVGTDSSTNIKMLRWAWGATGQSLVMRDGNGSISFKMPGDDANEPSDNILGVNKKYVNNNFLLKTTRGQASGVASLDSNKKIPIAQVPTQYEHNIRLYKGDTMTDGNVEGYLTYISTYGTPLTTWEQLGNIVNQRGTKQCSGYYYNGVTQQGGIIIGLKNTSAGLSIVFIDNDTIRTSIPLSPVIQPSIVDTVSRIYGTN